MSYRVLLNVRIERAGEPDGKFHVLGEVQIEPGRERVALSISMEEVDVGCMVFDYTATVRHIEDLSRKHIDCDVHSSADECDKNIGLYRLVEMAKRSFVAAGYILVTEEGEPTSDVLQQTVNEFFNSERAEETGTSNVSLTRILNSLKNGYGTYDEKGEFVPPKMFRVVQASEFEVVQTPNMGRGVAFQAMIKMMATAGLKLSDSPH